MNVRALLEQTADHLEQHPESYSFFASNIPNNTACKACILGWVGFFAHVKPAADIVADVADVFFPGPWEGKTSDIVFYDELTELCGAGWSHNPVQAARGARAYADKFFPKPEVILE